MVKMVSLGLLLGFIKSSASLVFSLSSLLIKVKLLFRDIDLMTVSVLENALQNYLQNDYEHLPLLLWNFAPSRPSRSRVLVLPPLLAGNARLGPRAKK
jgi:hypothetical protein